jgi:hypothetical protein
VRLSDAERDALLETLSAHAAAGRLDPAELERRVERVLTAATREEAAPALSDLPPIGAAATGRQPAQGPGRPRGHGETTGAAPDWQPTPERFRDPRSGRVMRVWVDGAGARHYVPD